MAPAPGRQPLAQQDQNCSGRYYGGHEPQRISALLRLVQERDPLPGFYLCHV